MYKKKIINTIALFSGSLVFMFAIVLCVVETKPKTVNKTTYGVNFSGNTTSGIVITNTTKEAISIKCTYKDEQVIFLEYLNPQSSIRTGRIVHGHRFYFYNEAGVLLGLYKINEREFYGN